MGCGKSIAVSAVVPAAKSEPASGGASASSSSAPKAAKAAAVPAEIISKKVAQSIKTGVLALRECGLKTLPPASTSDDHASVRTADLAENLLATLPESIGAWR